MEKVKPLIIVGSILLGIATVLTVFSVINFAEFLDAIIKDLDFKTTNFVNYIVLLVFALLCYSGGLFLIIFFSIRGKLMDKREKQVVDVKPSKEEPQK